MIFLGIDPGKTGALAALDGERAEVFDCPLTAAGLLDLAAMGKLLRTLAMRGEVEATIERVNSFRGEGHMGAFRFGENFGVWQGLLAGLGINFHLVRPKEWQRMLLPPAALAGRLLVPRKPLKTGRGKRDKSASLDLARKLFPTAELKLAKHHGRAEALLIAEYGRRVYRRVSNAGRWNAVHG